MQQFLYEVVAEYNYMIVASSYEEALSKMYKHSH